MYHFDGVILDGKGVERVTLRASADTFAATAKPAVDRLFVALVEELKSPLMQIARQAEYLETINKPASDVQLRYMRHNADMMLRLVDSYLFTLRLARESRAEFLAEPVSISSILHEARERLLDAARERNVELHLNIAGKYEPVLAHPQALTSAL